MSRGLLHYNMPINNTYLGSPLPRRKMTEEAWQGGNGRNKSSRRPFGQYPVVGQSPETLWPRADRNEGTMIDQDEKRQDQNQVHPSARCKHAREPIVYTHVQAEGQDGVEVVDLVGRSAQRAHQRTW